MENQLAEPVMSPLRKWRKAKRMTLAQLGEHLNMSKSRLSEIENGSGCSLRTALAIEDLTGGKVRPADLRSDEEPAA